MYLMIFEDFSLDVPVAIARAVQGWACGLLDIRC